MEPHRLLLEGGLLLGAIALSGLLFRVLQLSAIPAFILLGLALGTVVGEAALVEALGIFGVVLLLFFMGLEFSVRALVEGRRRLASSGLRDLALSFPVGLAAGLVLGWGVLGSLLLAGAFYVSSSAIIAKSLIELRRTGYPETEWVLGILVFEDIAIALLLAVLSGVVLAAGGLTAGVLGATRAVLFFAGVLLLARLGRGILDRLLSTEDDDLFLLVTGAAVLLLSWGAVRAGLSEAIGAFLAGTLLAETEHKNRIEGLFAPLQGLFAALFFVSFGLSIELGELAEVWPAALVLAALAAATKLGTGWWVGRAEGLSRRASFFLGVTLVPRGEFSIVLAGLAAAAGIGEAPALIALFILVLAVAGTAGIRHAPWLAARLFPPPREPTLADRGFRPELAGGEEASA